jgi:hypothetical protein
VKARQEDPGAGGLQLEIQGVDIPHHLLQDRRRGRISVGLIDAEEVLLHAAAGR